MPSAIVVDTNCFVDHIDIMMTLIRRRAHTYLIPIVVLNELEGLSKGSDDGNDKAVLAKKAFAEIEKESKVDGNVIRFVASSGEVMRSMQFRTEEVSIVI